MPIDYSFFFWIGSIDLLIMTISDLRTGFIDDRYNYLLFGVVAAMFFVSNRSIEYFLAVFVVATIFPMATKKFFAKGDITVMTWELLGLGLMGPTFLGMFFLLFPMYLGIHLAFRMLYKVPGKIPGLPILAGTFWTITAVFYIVFL